MPFQPDQVCPHCASPDRSVACYIGEDEYGWHVIVEQRCSSREAAEERAVELLQLLVQSGRASIAERD